MDNGTERPFSRLTPFLLMNLPHDLLPLVVQHIPMFRIELIMLKNTCTTLKKIVELVYPNNHGYISTQTDYTHHLKSICMYLPPIQCISQVHQLMDTSLKHGHLDNYHWLNTCYPTHTPHHVLTLLAKHNHFELFKCYFEQSYGHQYIGNHSPSTIHIDNHSSSSTHTLTNDDPLYAEKNHLIYTLRMKNLDEYITHAIGHQHHAMMDWCWASMLELDVQLKDRHPPSLTSHLLPAPPLVVHNNDYNVGRSLSLNSLCAAIESKNHTIIQWVYEKNPNLPFLSQAIRCNVGAILIQEIYTRYDRLNKEPLTSYMMKRAAENNDLKTLAWLHTLQCRIPDLIDITCPSIEGLTWLLKHAQGEKKLHTVHMECAVRHHRLSTLQWLYDDHHVQPDEKILITVLNLGHFKCTEWCWSLLKKTNPTLLKYNNWYLKISLNLNIYAWLRQHECYIEDYDAFGNSVHDITSRTGVQVTQKKLSVWSYVKNLSPSHETFTLMQNLSQHLPWSRKGSEYRHTITPNRLDQIVWLYEHQCPLTHFDASCAYIHGDFSMIQWLDAHQCLMISFESFLMALETNRMYNVMWFLKKQAAFIETHREHIHENIYATLIKEVLPLLNNDIASNTIIDPRQEYWQLLWKQIYAIMDVSIHLS